MTLTALVLLQVVSNAQFESPKVRESSGVAVSRTHPSVLWTHNDSGDGPYLYATDLTGRNRGRLLVPGAQALDWEDMAIGPCPVASRARGSCVYLADTGDNREIRPWVTVYAIPEPTPPQEAGDTLGVTSAPLVLRMRYPDGSHDVEAIYVSPRDTALFLVTKGAMRGSAIRVYRIDRAQWGKGPQETAIATRLQTLDIQPSPEAGRVVTSAAIRADGRLVAVRTYSEIYLFHPGVGGRLGPVRARCSIAGLESGGEAIDFLSDSTLVLTSEATGRRPGTIHTVKCSPQPERIEP